MLVNSEKNLQHYSELSGRNVMPAAYLNQKHDERITFLLPLLREGMRILEVGCAEGELGKRIKERISVDYTGIELSDDAIVASSVLDKVIREPNVFLGEQQFDLIISFHVLEHIVDPWNNVENWSRMLAGDGYIVVEVPNQSGHPFIVFDTNPEHIHQFNVASLSTLLQRADFNVKSIVTECFESPSYSDSIRVVAVKALSEEEKKIGMLNKILTAMEGSFDVYGIGGDFYNYIYPLLTELPVGFLYDSQQELQRKVVGEYHVKYLDSKSYDGQPILIASIRFQDQIKSVLLSMGIPENKIFYLSDILKVK